MVEYGRKQRYQMSRAVANSEKKSKQLKGIVDRRSNLQINNIANIIQRTAYVGNSMLVSEKTVDSFDDLSDIILVKAASTQEDAIMRDPYSRYYESENEFRKHVGGEPVPCGLIKHLAL